MAKTVKKKKELSEMTIHELHEMKVIVYDLSEKYSRQLDKYKGCDFDTYIKTLTPYEKELLDKRLKARKLYELIEKLIEEKVNEYYV